MSSLSNGSFLKRGSRIIIDNKYYDVYNSPKDTVAYRGWSLLYANKIACCDV